MASIRVTCKNEEETIKVLEIAEKEGYTWNNNVKPTSYRPNESYPYDIVMRKSMYVSTAKTGKEWYCSAQDFIDDYNIDHAEPFGISQKVKNEIILDFEKKRHEIRSGCDERECRNCKFFGDKDGETVCELDNADDATNEETFLSAIKLLMDVVASGDPHIVQLTTNEATEMFRKEIRALHGSEDTASQKRIEALKMAVKALEEKENEQ